MNGCRGKEMRVLYCFIYFCQFLNVAHCTENSTTLPLSCLAVPGSDNQLCMGYTQGSEEMYNDLLLFEKTAHEHLRFLTIEESSLVGQSSVWGFSKGGSYLVIETSEEGHAGYLVYETIAFMQYPQSTHWRFAVSDYFLATLVALDDDGIAIFEHLSNRRELSSASCLKDTTEYGYDDVDDVCLIKVNLHDYDDLQ